jgi:hypothetical protein
MRVERKRDVERLRDSKGVQQLNPEGSALGWVEVKVVDSLGRLSAKPRRIVVCNVVGLGIENIEDVETKSRLGIELVSILSAGVSAVMD